MEKKILEQIKINKLDQLEYGFMIAQLCVLNNEPYEQMSAVVKKLVDSGKLKLKSKQKTQTDKIDKATVREARRQKNSSDDELVEQAMKMLYPDPRNKKKLSTRVVGKISATSHDYAFLVPNDITMEDVFIGARDLHGAMNNDIVEAEVEYRSSGKSHGRVLKIIERANIKVVGQIKLTRKGAIVEPDDVKFGKDIHVALKDTMGANDGDKVVCHITQFFEGKRSPIGKVTEVLGKPSEIGTEVLAIMRSYNLYDDFPKNVKEVAESMPQMVDKTKYKNRKDLTRQLIFTIDGEDTRDIDDAVSLTKNKNGTYTLGVHIADVGEYVKQNSIIDNEAFKRATSVYFPDRVLPMLPRELSNGICSLNEREDRLALSCVMDIDSKGVVKKYDIFESIINSKKRFTYTQVQGILDGDTKLCQEFAQFRQTLLDMNELSHILIKMRENRGAIDFNFPEVAITLNDLGDVLEVKEKERKDAHRLIESFMIAANECIAEHFLKVKVPFVYRIHETPSEEKMSSFLNLVTNFGIETKANPAKVKPIELQKILKKASTLDAKDMISQICLRSLRKAKYSQECLGHFGLASTYYCHFTSPIRRYPDLTIHRIIKDVLHGDMKGQKLSNTKNFVIVSSAQSSEREVLAENVERDVDDLYRVFYMSHHIGEEFTGKVSGVTNFGVFVELDNTCEGLVSMEDLPKDNYEYRDDKYALVGKNNTYYIGKPVKVKVIRADILSREIDMILVKE